MQRNSRVAATGLLVILLATACQGTGSGGASQDATTSEPATASQPASAAASAEPTASAAPSDGAEDQAQRVDMSALAADPGSFVGQPITVLARVDQLLVDGAVFITSPSGTEEDQLAVVVRPDAQVDKEATPGVVLWVDATVVGVSREDLAEAGIDISPEDLGAYEGEYLLVADALRDPLAAG